jgi:hypothetical protein
MSTAYDLYAASLRELEHWQAPIWTPADFTYRFNKMRQLYVDALKKEYDRTQQVTDAMRPILKTAERELNRNGATDARTCPLPATSASGDAWERGRYQFLTDCRVTLYYTKLHGTKKAGARKTVGAKRLSAEGGIYTLDNHYWKPRVSDRDANVFYRVRGNTLELIFDTKDNPVNYAVAEHIEIGYMAAPNEIKLNSRSKTDPDNINSDWPPELDLQIVLLCVEDYRAANPAAADKREGRS